MDQQLEIELLEDKVIELEAQVKSLNDYIDLMKAKSECLSSGSSYELNPTSYRHIPVAKYYDQVMEPPTVDMTINPLQIRLQELQRIQTMTKASETFIRNRRGGT